MTSPPAAGLVLVLNVGSSSVKFALVDSASGDRPVEGLAERIGTGEAVVHVTGGGATTNLPLPGADHSRAVAAILDHLGSDATPHPAPTAVGHRVVHGGKRFSSSVLIDDDVVTAIEALSDLAPLHNPPALEGIRTVQASFPDLPQVAVFDTAFHHTLPPTAYRYAVPQQWYDDYDVRRYGFHGTSHRYVTGRTAEMLGRPADELDLVIAHLGNGCSAAAVHHGESVDTTMGMTPLEGLVMGSRSGDVDPGLFGYLSDRAGLSAAQTTEILNGESGLKALSGVTNDMREISQAAHAGDERARLAIGVFVHRLAKSLAGIVASLGRVDAVVFTGGIGEHSAPVRQRTLARLGFLGLEVDQAANRANGADTNGRITVPSTTVAMVVPTDEELLIARDTTALTGGDARG